MRRILVPLLFVGGGGFVLMFYLSGERSVPRRYAVYPSLVSIGTEYSGIAVGCILLFLAAYVILASILIKRLSVGLKK